MILSHNPASLQIPPESLFFSDSEPPHPRLKVPSNLHSFPFLIDSLFPSLPFSPVHVCGGFHLQDSRRRLSPRSTDLVASSFSRSFGRGPKTPSTPCSISHAMKDEHDSTEMVPRASVQCLVALDPPNLCNILVLSLSLLHRDKICFFCTSTKVSFSSKVVSQHSSVALLCNLFLSSTRPARTSCLSLNSYTSCVSS